MRQDVVVSNFKFVGMSHGDGESSYAKNSSLQGRMMAIIQPKFFAMIKSMRLPSSESPFRVADLGCSSGPNTIASVEAIIEQVKARYKDEGKGASVPEFQVFFQDLPTNDFNTLFKHLFSRPSGKAATAQNFEFMPTAVPGSFYNRLFPKSTMNIITSSHAIHWLSQIPDSVNDKASAAYNGGHSELHRSSLATVQAYAEQAERDFDHFLSARAEEVVSGGLILLVFGIRERFYPCNWIRVIHMQEDIWNTLVSEGLVSEELRDGYNSPIYMRTLEEVNKQLEKHKSEFEVEKQETVQFSFQTLLQNKHEGDPREMAKEMVKVSRGATGDSLEAYFGKTATDLFYERYEHALCELLTRENAGSAGEGLGSVTQILLGLRRK
ncbi:hypothetical protein R1sor_001437 [Riccia sorocarpa]|uniref:Uncharacterized protein n=1 Tax=Riccia sorocarpa TaxID=122646 RepID=A0ABD3GVY5_9MARC